MKVLKLGREARRKRKHHTLHLTGARESLGFALYLLSLRSAEVSGKMRAPFTRTSSLKIGNVQPTFVYQFCLPAWLINKNAQFFYKQTEQLNGFQCLIAVNDSK